MKRWTVALSILAVLLVATCRKETPEAPRPVVASGLPESGGTLVRSLQSDPGTMNPLLLTTEYEKQVLSYIFDPLLDLDERMKLIPALASSWEVSSDGRTYVFKIDPKATYSDGTPVLASDVVYTLTKIADPKTESVQFASLFEGLSLEETKALDPSTVQVVFDRPSASRLYNFNIPILPEHVYAEGNFAKDFETKVVGSGPYKLISRERGKQVVLERRDEYWRKAPWIDRVVFRVISDDAVAWNAIKRGEVDEMGISSDQWKLASGDPEISRLVDLHRYYDLSYNFIPWNNRDPVLSDKRVRLALSMCLDRPSLIENLYAGTARIVSGPFTSDQWAYNPEVEPVRFDPDGARMLLNSAGWTDSNGDGVLDKDKKKLSIEFMIRAGNKTSSDIAQVFQAALARAGVELRIKAADDATYFDRITTGNFQGAVLAWSLDIDPDPYSYFHSSQFPPLGQNFVFYSNPEVDRLLSEGREETDLKKRTDIYHEVHRLLAEDQPYTWTVQVSRKWAVSKRIHGVREAKGLGLFLWYPGPYEWWIPSYQRKHDRPGS